MGDVIRKTVKRDSAPPPRPQPLRKLPLASHLPPAEAAAYASEFGAAPADQVTDEEANVSPFEDDGGILPAKRFRGLAGSSRSDRARHNSGKRSRSVGPTNMRSGPPRAKRHRRELRELRSDASVELEFSAPRVGARLRSRIAAHWLSSSYRRVIDDTALTHWRSGQGDVSSANSSDTDVANF